MKLAKLPEAPDGLAGPVKAWSAPLMLPSYQPAPPDRNPMFLERRVFQGSSGRVYPLPFYDRIRPELTDREWQGVHVENPYLRVTVLPELGGRVYAMVDRINGYDVVYRNRAIKPALVGLAGPWLSGGIEFNWPQHHRPSTYMPCAWTIEEGADGSRTIWLSEHEPMTRMKGMHGVCLRPDSNRLELRVRLHNRTELTQTFLWWANVATDVSEDYQSFFPEDVRYIADHAKRATSAFPFCEGRYYGVDYAGRARDGVPANERPAQFVPPDARPANDLRWYSNIPVPTSYMCLGSREDFFGGYDHRRRAGIVHIADHRIAPGKKQWTWGNHDFGYAWDRNLTEPDEDGVYHPYIELMAGVFTDNQPDFSFLAPGETRSFSQSWYPIRDIGPAVAATLDAAIGLTVEGQGARVGILATRTFAAAKVAIGAGEGAIAVFDTDLSPAAPVLREIDLPEGTGRDDITILVTAEDGRVLAERALPDETPDDIPPPATEPPPPDQIASNDELWITGLHLEQYRHATRSPVPYWREALKRDPLDSRCNTALGLWHLRRAEFAEAEARFRKTIERQTRRNPNPPDGEAHYHLGIALRYLGDGEGAYDALSKAAWNDAWRAPADLALAEIDAANGADAAALDHVDACLRRDADNLAARHLCARLLARLARAAEAGEMVRDTRARDPLDALALTLAGEPVSGDDQLFIDLAITHARAGFFEDARRLVADRAASVGWAASPMLHYYAADYAARSGDAVAAGRHRAQAASAPRDHCFPSRLEDVVTLEAAIEANPLDASAPYYLGNLFYDRGRHREAISLWQKAATLDPNFSIAWRNLGIGCFNILDDPDRALAAYDRALAAAPDDARVLYERDQLWKRVGRGPADRLAELEPRAGLVAARDDLSLEFCALLNQLGRPEEAEARLCSRAFQPWEGGEGLVLDQWLRTKLALARKALAAGRPDDAVAALTGALDPPASLGEACHPFANQSDVHFWMARALEARGEPDGARRHDTIAAGSVGDFLGMELRAFSEKTYFSAMSLKRLGRDTEARELLNALRAHAEALMETPARIDYFATSLPTMLIFDDDLQQRQIVTAHVMRAEAALGLDQKEEARRDLDAALALDPNHPLAADLLGEVARADA